MNKKIILFDVDGTLTESTMVIKDEMIDTLKKIKKYHDLAIVSGGTFTKLKSQIQEKNLNLFSYIFAENGTTCVKNNKLFEINKLTGYVREETLQKIINFILRYIANLELPYKRGNFINFRNGMMYVTPIGSDCSYLERQDFILYDKEHNIRNKMIQALRNEFSDLDFSFLLGGSIGIGIHPESWDKTFCLKFLKDYQDIYFFGDRVERDGNDYCLYNHPNIIGFGTSGPEETMKILNSLFLRVRTSFEELKERIETEDLDIVWDHVKAYQYEDLINYDQLVESNCDFSKIAIVKLNGGLGTTMKCVGPKAIVKVKDDLSFLEIIINQIRVLNKKHNCQVPLILMNSYNTDSDPVMNKIIEDCQDIKILRFNQSKIPRIDVKSGKAMNLIKEDKTSYCPPGTGDFYESLLYSDIYPELIKMNIKHLFVSNIDNLNATPCPKLVKYLQNNSNLEFGIEVTPKTELDVKGGTFIDYLGKTKLLELAMVPKEHLNEFYSIEKFKTFNTNNIWLNLERLATTYKLDLLKNYKTVNDNRVMQIESVIGSAINNFDKTVIFMVGRDRYKPVKKIEDLERIKNEYSLNDDFILIKKN